MVVNIHHEQPAAATPKEAESAQRQFDQWVKAKEITEAFERKKSEFLEKEKKEREGKESAAKKLAQEKEQLESSIRLRTDALRAAKMAKTILENGFIEVENPKDKKGPKIKIRYRKDWLRDPKKGNRYLVTHWIVRAIQYASIPFAVLMSPWPSGRASHHHRPAMLVGSEWAKKWTEQRKLIVGLTTGEIKDSIKKIDEELKKDQAALAAKEKEIKRAEKK